MRGMKAKDLIAIVDFIYYGEVSISDTDLSDFLAAANEFQLKGLTESGWMIGPQLGEGPGSLCG